MPALANITVKKSDGTTDIIYDAINPAGGDGLPALWRSQLATILAAKPSFECWSRWNGPKTARRVQTKYVFPQVYTDTTTTLVQIKNLLVMETSSVIPQQVDTATIGEFAAQGTNLVASALIKSTINAGFAPT